VSRATQVCAGLSASLIGLMAVFEVSLALSEDYPWYGRLGLIVAGVGGAAVLLFPLRRAHWPIATRRALVVGGAWTAVGLLLPFWLWAGLLPPAAAFPAGMVLLAGVAWDRLLR